MQKISSIYRREREQEGWMEERKETKEKEHIGMHMDYLNDDNHKNVFRIFLH